MYQQINLYQPVLADTQQKLSATTLAVTLILVTLALTGFAVNAQVQVRNLDQQVAAIRSQAEQQQNMLAQLGDLGMQARPDDPQIRADRLAAELDVRKRALELLKQGAAGQTSGFAQRLEALARQHADGVWIDHLRLSGVNGSMSLNGVALDPAMVPAYLNRLARESVLSGTRFDEFTIERPLAPAPADDPEAKPAAVLNLPSGAVRFRAGSRELSAPGEENRS